MYLNNWSRLLITFFAAIALLMIAILGLHLFDAAILKIGLYSQLFGALLGGFLVVIAINIPIRLGEEAEPWLGRERLAWTLIGLGAICWGLGEAAYRYELAYNLPNFPALSDWGYSAMPILVFAGLLLQPSSDSGRGRLVVLLDSLISMGAILAIAWFLLLGSMAQTPNEDNLAKFLGLYYPISDMALLSCVIFLILRGQGRIYEATSRRAGLILVALGICIFAVSDFNYNVQNNFGTYVDGTWADLGWPLGLMTIGLAAYLRRFILSTPSHLVEERVRRHEEHSGFNPVHLVPYALLALLFFVLVINVLSHDSTQIWNRPVLLFATVGVVTLVVVRQLLTQLENERLSRRQSLSLERLAAANARIEEQARVIADHNADLEEGLAHLKAVQAQIANGNLRARARISSGSLTSLAGSLNLMADRLTRFEQIEIYTQKLTRALTDLSRAFEQSRSNPGLFTMPASCQDFPEIYRLLISMGMKHLPSQPAATASEHVSGPLSRPTDARSSSQPLANSRPAHPTKFPSKETASQVSGQQQERRSSSSSLSSPGLRSETPRPRTDPTTPSGSLRGSSLPGLPPSPDPSEQNQLEFPPSFPWSKY